MPTFREIPESNKSPAVFGEFDPIGQPGAAVHTVLLVGTKLATGTAPALVPQAITGDTQGDGLFGIGAQLAEMSRAFRAVNRTSRLLALALDAPAGAAASGTFTITGPATEDGELALYVGGVRVPVEVNDGDDATAIAAAVAAAIDANTRLPVEGSSALGVATATARWNGTDGNAIILGHNLRDTDRTPAGVGVVIAQMAGGAGAPDLAAVVAVLEEQVYDSIVCGPGDMDEVLDLTTEIERRWTAPVALDGHVFAAARGNFAALAAIGNAKNTPALTIMGCGTSPTPPWIWAAQTAAAEGSISDPGLPRFGIVLPDCLPPPVAERFDHGERNLLLADGISTHRVDSGGRCIVDRLVTTYQTNAFGGEDDTWEALTTRRTASFLRRDWIALIQAKYPDYKLADDGTQVNPGVKVVTPSVIAGEALAWYETKMHEGHVEDFESFRATLAASRPSDPTRVDMLQEPNLTNELVTIATLFAFRV